MAIGIDEIDDFESGGLDSTSFEPEPSHEGSGNNEDYLTSFLKTKGIEDPSKILFEGDNNEVVERSWEDLSNEEKFNILNTPTEPETPQQQPEITEDEAQFLNELRSQGISIQQFIQSIQENPTNNEPVYKVDDLDDDQLFLLDLESRVGELTEEQGAEYLNLAKQNEDMYKRQIEGIRREYKEREEYQAQQEQAALEQEAQEQFAQYQRVISNAIDSMNSVGNLELNLEDNDKEDLAAFILSQDQNGNNYLQSALQDPNNIVRVAWFLLNGDEAFNDIETYFTNQIKKVSEAQYKKGYEDAKKGSPSRQVVFSTPKTNPNKKVMTIEDLD